MMSQTIKEVSDRLRFRNLLRCEIIFVGKNLPRIVKKYHGSAMYKNFFLNEVMQSAKDAYRLPKNIVGY